MKTQTNKKLKEMSLAEMVVELFKSSSKVSDDVYILNFESLGVEFEFYPSKNEMCFWRPIEQKTWLKTGRKRKFDGDKSCTTIYEDLERPKHDINTMIFPENYVTTIKLKPPYELKI